MIFRLEDTQIRKFKNKNDIILMMPTHPRTESSTKHPNHMIICTKLFYEMHFVKEHLFKFQLNLTKQLRKLILKYLFIHHDKK